MDIYGKSFSLFAAALFTALPFASVRADDALADLVPAYHFAFDGDCAQASDASETSFAFGGENPSDATYYRSTRTGENGKALCVTSGSAHPWNSSISTGGGDFTVVCSVRSGTFDRGSLWCVGDKTRGLSLVTHGPAKVGLGNWYDNAFYAKWDDGKDSTALIDVPTAASEFHTYAVVYHSASGNGTADIYVDGVKKGVANDIAINSTTPLQIGGVYGGGDISYRAQSALIDDWRLYRTALADAQIAEYATAFPVQQTAVDNTWTATEEGAWSDVANWSTGSVPSATDTVEIPSGAIITLNGDKSVDTVIIAGDGEATFKPSGNNWSKLQPERIVTSGTATLVLESHYNASNARGAVGIEARGDKPIVIEVPVVLRDSTNSTSQDSWFKGQSATSYIYVQNSLTVESGYLLVYGRTVFNGDLSVNTKFATSNSGNQPRYNQTRKSRHRGLQTCC